MKPIKILYIDDNIDTSLSKYLDKFRYSDYTIFKIGRASWRERV